MPSDNPFLNAFGKQGREKPPGVLSEMPNLGVPTQVPLVRPPDVVPDNLGDMARFNKFNQLAQALGTTGLGSGQLGRTLQEAMKKRQAAKDADEYSKGLLDATSRSAKTRDIFTDITTNGWIGEHQNPWYQMGYQTHLAQELAAQYRADIITKRMSSPLTAPQDIQDPIKQKYLPLFQQARPDIMGKFFVEPSAEIDKEDQVNYEKAQSDAFKTERARSVSATIGATITSEMALTQGGRQDATKAYGNIAKSIETAMDTAAATGMPYSDIADSAISVVSERARLLPGLSEKLGLLGVLRDVKLPGGNAAINDGNYLAKLTKVQEDIVNQAHKEELDSLQAEKLRREANAASVIDQMFADSRDGKLKGKITDYLPTGGVTGSVDYKAVDEVWTGLTRNNGGNLSTHDEDSKVAELNILAQDGSTTPSQIIRRGQSLGLPVDRVIPAAHTAAAVQQHNAAAKKSGAVPASYVKEFQQSLSVPSLGYAQSKMIPGVDWKSAAKHLENTMQMVYGGMYRQEMNKWLGENPGATPSDIDAQSNVVGSRLRHLATNAQTQVLSGRLSWADFTAGKSKASLDSAGYNPQAKNTNPDRYKNQYKWAFDESTWKQVAQQYSQARSGPLMDFAKDGFAKANLRYKHMPAEYWLSALEKRGFRTWRTKGMKSNGPAIKR